MKRSIVLFAIAFAGAPRPAPARDYGQVGQLFPIVEPDLLSTIEHRLARMSASGAVARANAAFARSAEERVRHPVRVAGVKPASEPRTWDFDPTVRVERDVRDAGDRLIARAGQAINPLEFVTVRQALVFIDGDEAAQISWATRRYDPTQAKIIMVSGSPLEAMTRWRRRFYFDQGGRLTTRLGITHTPAIGIQAGTVLRLSEIPLSAKASAP